MPTVSLDEILRTLHVTPGVDRVVRREDTGGLLPRAVVYLSNGRILSLIKFSSNFVFDVDRPYEIAELSSDLSLFNHDAIQGLLTVDDVIEVVKSYIGVQGVVESPTATMLSHRRIRKLKI